MHDGHVFCPPHNTLFNLNWYRIICSNDEFVVVHILMRYEYEIFWDQINQLFLAAAHYLSIAFWEGTLVARVYTTLAPWSRLFLVGSLMLPSMYLSNNQSTSPDSRWLEYGNGNWWEIPIEFHQLPMVWPTALHKHPKKWCINFCVSPWYFLDINTDVPYNNNQQKKNYIREFWVRSKMPISLPD